MKHLTSGIVVKTISDGKKKQNLAIIVVEDGSNNCVSQHSQENSDW